MLIRSKRSFDAFSHQLGSSHYLEVGVVLLDSSLFLVSHVLSSSFAHHEVFVVLHCKKTILTIGLDVAVGLSIHSFSTESCANQKDFLVSMSCEAFWHIDELQLDTDIFLRSHTFSLLSVVISTSLLIKFREDSGSLSLDDLAIGLEVGELPSDE